MKTNRFDDILRRKLESIQPDFQDQDWEKWQAFRQHATPGFWQTYGHWLGYAGATLTTAVMVVLYLHQSTQNEELLKEMQALRQQVTRQTPAGVPQAEPPKATATLADTVYIVERRNVYIHRSAPENDPRDNPSAARSVPHQGAGKNTWGTDRNDVAEYHEKNQNLGEGTLPVSAAPTRPETYSTIPELPQGTPPAIQVNSEENKEAGAAESHADKRLGLGEIADLPNRTYTAPATDVSRRLQSRMPQPAKALVADQGVVPAKDRGVEKPKSGEPGSKQKVEKAGRDERLLPTFGRDLPYRVGLGQQWEGRTKAFGIWNEVLLGKHWSVQTGLSWQKLENQKFYNDRVFRDKTHEDFRRTHAKRLPPSFDIFNITTQSTLTRIPLGLTYRGDLGNAFSYLIGTGTNLNLRAKQVLSFDFKRPTNDFGQQSAERNLPFPLINNMLVSAGVEKRWSPIVLQVNSFVDTRIKTFPYLKDRTNVGLQIKLLYGFGVMKKN